MSEIIKPIFEDGEPVCRGEGEGCHQICGQFNVDSEGKGIWGHCPKGSPCTPGVKQQRDDARRQLEKLRKERQENLRCSYCGKKAREVWKLIANPINDPVRLYICDECSGLIVEILEKEKAAENQGKE